MLRVGVGEDREPCCLLQWNCRRSAYVDLPLVMTHIGYADPSGFLQHLNILNDPRHNVTHRRFHA